MAGAGREKRNHTTNKSPIMRAAYPLPDLRASSSWYSIFWPERTSITLSVVRTTSLPSSKIPACGLPFSV